MRCAFDPISESHTRGVRRNLYVLIERALESQICIMFFIHNCILICAFESAIGGGSEKLQGDNLDKCLKYGSYTIYFTLIHEHKTF